MASLAYAVVLLAVPAAALAQSTGPVHSGYDPRAAVAGGGHYHEGEIGEKLLVVEHALRCNCGCGLDTHSCQFQMQCGTSPVWTARIRRSLEAGQTPEEVTASFVAEYGPQVLMAPPPEGFNLVGYLLPGSLILVAGLLVVMLARRNEGGRAPVAAFEIPDEDAERLREELRRLDEAESPDW
ncbi:MAG TPA: cytochrome c-type biogenesis protein CcmH [Longimicrobiales bacterium]|nr:cytochrome c-type biogenesis protein CcmH [Longimicrobiales bacterium]